MAQRTFCHGLSQLKVPTFPLILNRIYYYLLPVLPLDECRMISSYGSSFPIVSIMHCGKP